MDDDDVVVVVVCRVKRFGEIPVDRWSFVMLVGWMKLFDGCFFFVDVVRCATTITHAHTIEGDIIEYDCRFVKQCPHSDMVVVFEMGNGRSFRNGDFRRVGSGREHIVSFVDGMVVVVVVDFVGGGIVFFVDVSQSMVDVVQLYFRGVWLVGNPIQMFVCVVYIFFVCG